MPDTYGTTSRSTYPSRCPADRELRGPSPAVALPQAGHSTLPEWITAISAEIRQAQADGDPDLGSTYYRHWLAAFGKLVVAKALADDGDLRLRHFECAANPPGKHDHPARREPIRVV